MAGGISPIDFWAVFNATADSAARKRLAEAENARAEQQMAWTKEDRAHKLEMEKLASEQRAQLPGLVEKANSGDQGALASLFTVNPDIATKIQENLTKQTEAAPRLADEAQARAERTANLQRLLAAAPPGPGRDALLQQAMEGTRTGRFDRFEVAGPQTTPQHEADLAAGYGQASALADATKKQAPESATGDLKDFRAIMASQHPDIKETDPKWGAMYQRFLDQQNKSRATQINNDLSGRALAAAQMSGRQAEIVSGLIDQVYQLTNGNPDMFGNLMTRGAATAADLTKALGLPENATAEDISNRKAQVDQLLGAIKANSTFKTEDGGEMNFGGALTQGTNLGAGLEALRRQMDVIRGVNANYGVRTPGRGAKGAKPEQQPRPSPQANLPPPNIVAEIRARAAKGDKKAQAALANIEAHGGQ